MSAPEFHLQKSICEVLDAAYPQVWYAAIPNGAALCATNDPVGRQRAKREIAKLKITGMRVGAPDMILCWAPGKTCWLEIKSPKGPVSQEQRDVHRDLMFLGHRIAICRSVEDLHRAMAEFGVPSRLSA